MKIQFKIRQPVKTIDQIDIEENLDKAEVNYQFHTIIRAALMILHLRNNTLAVGKLLGVGAQERGSLGGVQFGWYQG